MKRPEYIVEFIAQGRFVKVSAIDPATGREAVLVGDARAGRDALAKEAVKKLEYLLLKGEKDG
ncbi:MAG: hypothetical protein WDN72_04255 [Alphaproteobacteria bacterium]